MGTNNITVRYITVIRHVQGILDKLFKNFFQTGGSGGMSCRGEGGEETVILMRGEGVGLPCNLAQNLTLAFSYAKIFPSP